MSQPLRTYQFPPGFLWGAATSSHQVEGDNRWNDWWEYEQTGRMPHKSGEACLHYQLFERDFDLALSWGHNAHRFSIEWSRIEPFQGSWDMRAMDHYREVVRALKERGLEPVVTLHHFTNPAWFAHQGGWLRRDSAKLFARYTEYVVKNLGAEVKYWLTVNEPMVYVMQGYITGEWPPCLKAAWLKAAFAFKNLSRAHVAAYQTLHQSRGDVMVSFAHNAPLIFPCDPGRRRDRVAAAVRDFILNLAFFSLIRARPRQARQAGRNLDFIGLNYYTRNAVRSTGWGVGAFLGRACHLPHHSDQGPLSAIGWEIYPQGLGVVLEKFSRFALPLLVTENGVATDDETVRREFIMRHLESVAGALEKGVNVIGYLYWTLMDNFEWALGTQARFGLAHVDFRTQRRLPRPCAEDFSRVCRTNSLLP